jgi:hypothetical protein
MGLLRRLVLVVEVSLLNERCGYALRTRSTCTAGANLMGSDLYNNLIRYFITHLKSLRDVRKRRCVSLLVTNPRDFL